MSDRAAQLRMTLIKGILADMPQEERDNVEAAAAEVREVVSRHGDEGKMAVSLVVSEIALEEARGS